MNCILVVKLPGLNLGIQPPIHLLSHGLDSVKRNIGISYERIKISLIWIITRVEKCDAHLDIIVPFFEERKFLKI